MLRCEPPLATPVCHEMIVAADNVLSCWPLHAIPGRHSGCSYKTDCHVDVAQDDSAGLSICLQGESAL
eukprot:SAG31_NODE_7466_length_1682_cov_1.352495_2_plen_67_part_01